MAFYNCKLAASLLVYSIFTMALYRGSSEDIYLAI